MIRRAAVVHNCGSGRRTQFAQPHLETQPRRRGTKSRDLRIDYRHDHLAHAVSTSTQLALQAVANIRLRGSCRYELIENLPNGRLELLHRSQLPIRAKVLK